MCLFAPAALALGISASAAAQTATDVSATFSWPTGNEDTATISINAADFVSSTSFASGSDLKSSIITGATYDNKFETSGVYSDMATWQPGTSNAGNSADDMIEFKVTLKKGITFKPTSVSYDAIKNGSDGATYSWSYTVNGTESDIIDVDAANVKRDKKGSEAELNHKETITSEGGKTFSFRIYISKCANNKKISIGNVKINGTLNGEVVVRKFVDFAVNFRTDPYTVTLPASGTLPAGVSINGGAFHDVQHGYNGNPKVVVPVDGPVKFTIGTCQYGSSATVVNSKGETLATLDTKTAGCDNQTSTGKNVVWTYNVEQADTLTFTLGGYCPYFQAAQCDLLPDFTVSYFDQDGNLLGKETVQGGSDLAFAYSQADITVADGYAFRGWFNSDKASASKVSEGTAVQANLNLYAKVTAIEKVSQTARFIYNIAASNFYVEDHECIDMKGGSWHDAQHGWSFSANGTISVPVGGKAIVSVVNCAYSADTIATVTDAKGNEVATFRTKAATDGAETSFRYDGDATTLTITFAGTAYIANVSVFNVVDFVEFDEASGYYVIPAGDVNSFLRALTEANSKGNVRIFLPDGLYDLGETVLTPISGNNISIIGQSMDKTIIRNAPLVENEGIGTTATFFITAQNTYFQDLTIQNALDYYKSGGAGRAVCIQDKGTNTICKNVKLLSYQDTYYSNNNAGKFYWEDSEIHGTVDYICGGGDAYFNRCLLVNETRTLGSKAGETVIAAPYTDGSNWGYVFNECTVENLSSSFSFARAWGGTPRCAFLNTTLNQPSEISSSRYTPGGMNVPADKFVEFNSLDANGNVVSPATNVLTFTKGDASNKMETILTAEEAAAYDLSKVFTDWKPATIAAQMEVKVSATDGKVTWTGNSDVYAIFNDGEFVTFTTANEYATAETDKITVRAANGRGGLGHAFKVGESTGIADVDADAEVVSTSFFSLAGARLAAPQRGVNIVVRTLSNGEKVAARVVVK